MSFSKTVSVCAALASIFGVGAAGYKIAQDNQSVDNQNIQTKYEERITELQQQVSKLQQQAVNTNPPTPVTLPQPTPVKQTAPAVPTLPTPPIPTPPSPPAAGNFE